MKKFELVVNTTIDENAEYYEKNCISHAPLSYTIEGKTIVEDLGVTMTSKEFYTSLRNGNNCITSQTPVETYYDLYRKPLSQGMDVMFIGMSSGVSGSYQAGVIAANDIADEFPNNKIECIDSLTATGGMRILVGKAVELRDNGTDLQTATKILCDLRLKIITLITPDDLHHLYRGGRLSKSSAVVGSIIGIKPIIEFTNEGKLEATSKARGRLASFKHVVKATVEQIVDKAETVWITHGDCLDEAKKLQEMLEEEGITTEIRELGTVLGTHAGPGTMTVNFIGSKRCK